MTRGGRTRSSAPARGQRHACGSSAAFDCRHVLVVLLWHVVARRVAAGGIATAAAARAAVAPEKNRGGRARRKKERERRERGVNRTLTHFYPNFCIETRKTVNIEVGGNLKIYNFRVGRNFI